MEQESRKDKGIFLVESINMDKKNLGYISIMGMSMKESLLMGFLMGKES